MYLLIDHITPTRIALHVLLYSITLFFIHFSSSLAMETDENNTALLLCATTEGNVDTAKKALEQGADPNGDSQVYSPLYLAAFNGHVEIVKLLIAKGADIDWATEGTKKSPLYAAAVHGHMECALELLRAGALTCCLMNDKKQSILMKTFVQHHDIPMTKLLLEYGASAYENPGLADHHDTMFSECFPDQLECTAAQNFYVALQINIACLYDTVKDRSQESIVAQWSRYIIPVVVRAIVDSPNSSLHCTVEERQRLSRALLIAAVQGNLQISQELLLPFGALPYQALERINHIYISRLNKKHTKLDTLCKIRELLLVTAQQHRQEVEKFIGELSQNTQGRYRQLPSDLIKLLRLYFMHATKLI